jgi:flagellar biosynthesis protein FlhF
MRVKSYFAPSVETAISQARREIGEDALLLGSRATKPEARHLGAYEVVFGMTSQQAGHSGKRPAVGAQEATERRQNVVTPPLPEHSSVDQLMRDVASLRNEMTKVNRALRGTGPDGDSAQPNSELAATLLCRDLEPEVVDDLCRRAKGHFEKTATCQPNDADAWRPAVENAFHEVFRIGAEVDQPQRDRYVIVVIGPPGGGKTSALVKLAVRLGVASRRSTQILSVDGFRVAASEQLRAYASILGAGFQQLDYPEHLPRALNEYRQKGLVVIDTPGLGPKDMDAADDLAAVISALPDAMTHLVIPATAKRDDIRTTIERFRVFKAKRLLFTRLDETSSYGSMLSELARSELAASYVSNGQQIPEDFAPATAGLLMELALGKCWEFSLRSENRAKSAVAEHGAGVKALRKGWQAGRAVASA